MAIRSRLDVWRYITLSYNGSLDGLRLDYGDKTTSATTAAAAAAARTGAYAAPLTRQ